MKHHDRRFMGGSLFRYGSGYTPQNYTPEAKRFRHERWNGMAEGAFAQSLPNPFRSNVGLQNQYQHAVPYGQQCGRDFSNPSYRHSFGGWSDFSPNQQMMYPTFYSQPGRQPSKSGYSRASSRPKRGSRCGGNQYTNKSTSDLKVAILDKLVTGGHMQTNELVHLLSCHKKEVNRVLYAMQKEGIIDKVSDKPPVWALKRQLNVSSADTVNVPETYLHHVSAQSVVPLDVEATNDERSVSDTSESYDVIPAVAVRRASNSVQAAANARTIASVSCGLDPPKTAVNSVLRVQAINDKQPSSGVSESYDVIPATAIEYSNVPVLADVHTFAYSSYGVHSTMSALNVNSTVSCSAQNVYQRDITRAVVSSSSNSICSLSDASTVSSVNTFDIPRQGMSTVSGELLQTVFGELKKPAGRGRGVLFLNAAVDRLTKVSSASSLLTASSQPERDEAWPKDARCADLGQFYSGIGCSHMTPTSNVNSPVSVDKITDDQMPTANKTNCQLTTKSELRHHDKMLTENRKVSKGPTVDQPSGSFKPPLPPKQLIRTDSAYKAAADWDASFHLKDNGSLLLRSQSHSDDTESDSYKSLSDSLSSLSFRASSVPRSYSFDDLNTSYMPGYSVDRNPFAAALGIDDSSGASAGSSGQMPEGAGGLSLTSESFAALNKNSVSALMEYGQSRHASVEIKCIGSFGPPHRPVYVFIVKILVLLLPTPTGVGFSSSFVCLSVYPCKISRTKAARITKRDTELSHHESWKPIYFGVRMSKVTSHINIAGMGFCTLVSAGFF